MHGKLRERLIQVASYYQTCVKSGSEAYTSKKCGKCGCINISGKEVFTCSICMSEANTDIHAARNILLRFIQK